MKAVAFVVAALWPESYALLSPLLERAPTAHRGFLPSVPIVKSRLAQSPFLFSRHHPPPPPRPPPRHPRKKHNSYAWVKEQRKLALTRAYMLLRQPDGTVTREDWVRLMACLRPDCSEDHVRAGGKLRFFFFFFFSERGISTRSGRRLACHEFSHFCRAREG